MTPKLLSGYMYRFSRYRYAQGAETIMSEPEAHPGTIRHVSNIAIDGTLCAVFRVEPPRKADGKRRSGYYLAQTHHTVSTLTPV